MTDVSTKLIAGRYQLLEVLGKGGQATVYRAIDQQTEGAVAVKRLNSQASRDPSAVVRVAREQQALRQLAGTYAVELLDVCHDDNGAVCLVMEFLDGIDLEKELAQLELKGELMPIERIISVMSPIVQTLERAHSVGIMHRDLKPGNVFLLKPESGGGARLLDFGFARLRSSQSITRAGYVMGSPNYIAPEMWRGEVETADTRVDIYALGVILFRLLCGRLPFEQESLLDKLHAVTRAPRPSLHALQPTLPKRVDGWVERALAIAPDDRFPSAQSCWSELLDALGVTANSSRLPPAAEESSDLWRIRQWLEAPVVASTSVMQAALRSATETFRRWMGSLRPLEAAAVGPRTTGSENAAEERAQSSAEVPQHQSQSTPSTTGTSTSPPASAPAGDFASRDVLDDAGQPTMIRVEPLRVPNVSSSKPHGVVQDFHAAPTLLDVSDQAKTLLQVSSHAQSTRRPRRQDTLLAIPRVQPAETEAPAVDQGETTTPSAPGTNANPASALGDADERTSSDDFDDQATYLDVRLQAACDTTSLAISAPRVSPTAGDDSATAPLIDASSHPQPAPEARSTSEADAEAPFERTAAARKERRDQKASGSATRRTSTKTKRSPQTQKKRAKASKADRAEPSPRRSSARGSSKSASTKSSKTTGKRSAEATKRSRKTASSGR